MKMRILNFLRHIGQAVAFYALLPWLYALACLPFKPLYIIADMLCWFVSRLYRRKIVRKNLRAAFPHQSPQELVTIEKAFYAHFCDLLVEYIKSLTLTKAQVIQRCVIQPPKLLSQLCEEGKDILLVTGHYGNWEWAANAIALQTKYSVGVIYKSLSNLYFDRLVQRLRRRFDKLLIHEQAIFRTLLSQHATPQVTAFLADQAPAPTHAFHMPFLNIPTYVTTGLEKIATKLDPTVVYVHIRKPQRGHYSIELEVLTEQPSALPASRLTQLYIERLEQNIDHNPALWLWSHNRWKDTDLTS